MPLKNFPKNEKKRKERKNVNKLNRWLFWLKVRKNLHFKNSEKKDTYRFPIT